eukprot:TRINITY_DN4445_c0_g1_i1.p1 TRINITY_DN4445_c0_g1~~TRINITY_DN4445_c0_g1_i1.p1  ORF type:complete len:748 (+),score=114.06 TRINITY_DN4445_c0_g1_i1:24-2267(+)
MSYGGGASGSVGGSASTAQPQRFLIGKEGRDAVVGALSAEDPRRVLQRFQSEYNLENTLSQSCQPAFKLLELLDTSRAEVNVGLLAALSGALSERTVQLPPDALSHLIQISYPYVAFDELRPTVFEAMRGHESIPPRVLDLLLADPYLKTHRPDILSSLAPIQVRQQLWARDPNGAYASMLSLICRRFHNELPSLNHQILFEAASSFRQSLIHLMGSGSEDATAADQPSTNPSSASANPNSATNTAKSTTSSTASKSDLFTSSDTVQGTQLRLGATLDAETQRSSAQRVLSSLPSLLSRRVILRRKRGAAAACLHELLDNLGTSTSLYSAALAWFRTQPVELADARHDLLMAAHDLDRRSLCEADPIYRASWVLDACLKDDQFDERRLKELENLLVAAHSSAAVSATRPTLKVAVPKPPPSTTRDEKTYDGMRLRNRHVQASSGTASRPKSTKPDDTDSEEDEDEDFDLGVEWMDVSSDEGADEELQVRSSKRRKLSEDSVRSEKPPRPATAEDTPSSPNTQTDAAYMMQDRWLNHVFAFHTARRILDLLRNGSSKNSIARDQPLQRLFHLFSFPSSTSVSTIQELISVLASAFRDPPDTPESTQVLKNGSILPIIMWTIINCIFEQNVPSLFALTKFLDQSAVASFAKRQPQHYKDWQLVFFFFLSSIPNDHPLVDPCLNLCKILMGAQLTEDEDIILLFGLASVYQPVSSSNLKELFEEKQSSLGNLDQTVQAKQAILKYQFSLT